MPFNYNFQTDDEAISQKWNEAKIGNSNTLSADFSQNQNSNPQNQNSNFQFTIRKAQSSDAESVVRINKNSWLETYPSVEFGITREDILTIDWEKNLEKTKNNLEKVENLYLLEINSANPETSKNWEKPENQNWQKLEITDLKGKELAKNSTKEEVEIDQNLQIDEKLPELTIPETQKNEMPNLELAKIVISEEKSKNPVQNKKIPKIDDLEEIKNTKNNPKVIGFVRFGVNEENRSQIRAIYLDPDFVDLGFGTDLMIFAIEKLGFEHNFEVKAASYNQRAIRFYQKFGFKISDKKCENFELKSGKFIPQIQMLVNKDKIIKKIAQIKTQAKSRGEKLGNKENLGKSEINNSETKNLQTESLENQNLTQNTTLKNLEKDQKDEQNTKFQSDELQNWRIQTDSQNNQKEKTEKNQENEQFEQSEKVKNLGNIEENIIPNFKLENSNQIKTLENQNTTLKNNENHKTQKTQENNQTFTILTPPPNLTGNLHAGHALEHFIMDSLSRFERQNGKQVLYYPGIDHAGIQLEGVINKFINNGEFDEFLKGKSQDLQANLGNSENHKSQILETKKSKNEIN